MKSAPSRSRDARQIQPLGRASRPLAPLVHAIVDAKFTRRAFAEIVREGGARRGGGSGGARARRPATTRLADELRASRAEFLDLRGAEPASVAVPTAEDRFARIQHDERVRVQKVERLHQRVHERVHRDQRQRDTPRARLGRVRTGTGGGGARGVSGSRGAAHRTAYVEISGVENLQDVGTDVHDVTREVQVRAAHFGVLVREVLVFARASA